MAQIIGEVPGLKLTLPADADYSAEANQYTIVKIGSDSNGATIEQATAATDNVIGVLQNRPKAGEACEVTVTGISFLRVDSTTDIAIGDAIAPTTAGVGIKTTTALHSIVGYALAARSANDTGIIPVLLAGPASSVKAAS